MKAKNTSGQNQEDSGHNYGNQNETHRKHLSGINEDEAGNDLSEENREARHHHQEHGNRRYKMFSNHSSADDQPQTNTDLTP